MEPLPPLEDLYDLQRAETLADPVPLAEGRPRPLIATQIEPLPRRVCPMADVELDAAGDPID